LAPSRITITEHVLDACAKYDRPLLLASTAEVYGRTICGVAKETDPLVLSPDTSPSVVATLFAERAAVERGLRVVIARVFDLASEGILGRLLQAARSGRPLSIFGTGEQQRTFLHPEDAAAILVRLMETPAALGRPVNVGGTCAISLHDLARRLQQLTRPRPPIVRTPEAAYEEERIPCRLPSLTRLRSLIGPLPERTIDRLLLSSLTPSARSSRLDAACPSP
jgi:UDP-glucose 4-epimerase